MATTIKSRIPLLLLLGIIFLASVSVTYANYDDEGTEPRAPGQRERGRQEGEKGGSEPRVPGQRERGRQEGEKEEKRHGELTPSHEKTKREERERRHQHEGDEEQGSSKSQERRNPFLFKSNNYFTTYENENGYIRRLKRFDQRSDLFENLQNYRLVEYRAKPHTIFLPHHIDADFILTVLSGKAILTVLSPNDRNSYNLKSGDTIKIPSGTTAYIVNQDDEEDLRVVDLVIPVNRPGKFESFDKYLRGFSKNILEASYNTKYETIEKVLLDETRQQGQEIQAIVKVPREQIAELRKLARSSSRKSLPSEFEPINLRSQNPKYSNKFGRLFEITPQKKYPQLQDLDMFVSSVDIKEGGLLLPHYNSRAIVVLLVNEGKGNLELVGLRNEQEEERERESEKQDRKKQVERYEARLSPGDIVIIPAGHPVAIRASSNLNLLGFGINAENNQRNFLSGSDDNVISQIDNPVKDLTFPGSAQEVNRLLKNQEQSHFANARPEQKEEGSQGRRSPLSSILNTFY